MSKDKAAIRYELRELQTNYEGDTRTYKNGFEKAILKLREQLEVNHQQLVEQYEEQVKELKQDLELRRAVEIHEIEERKNQHINDLLTNHQEAFDRIKSYYNDITHDNLQLIRSLKDDIWEMRQREKQNQKRMHDLTVQNKQ